MDWVKVIPPESMARGQREENADQEALCYEVYRRISAMTHLNKPMFFIFISSSLIMWKMLNFNNLELPSTQIIKTKHLQEEKSMDLLFSSRK